MIDMRNNCNVSDVGASGYDGISAVLKCGHGYHYRGRGKTGRKVGEDGVGEAGGDHSLALKSVPADGEHRPRQ